MSLTQQHSKEMKHELIKMRWAETHTHVVNMSDEELIAHINTCEKAHIQAQTDLEIARHIAKERAESLRGKFAAEQRELDRKYQPRPADKVEFDKKARAEKVGQTKDEKAIALMMGLGLTREQALERLHAGKEASK